MEIANKKLYNTARVLNPCGVTGSYFRKKFTTKVGKFGGEW